MLKKRVLAIVLSITVMISMMPAIAAADTAESADSSQTAQQSEDQIIVGFNNKVSDKKMDKIVEANDDQVSDVTDTKKTNVAVVELDSSKDVDEAVSEYEDMDEVKYAEPNYKFESLDSGASVLSTNDAKSSSQWYMNTVKATSAWKIAESYKKQSRTKVAVIDTGVNPNHSDLQGSLDKSNSVNVVTGGKTTYDVHSEGHGTHVAGIIGATANNGRGIAGVASGNNNNLIDMMCINVFQNIGGSVGAYTSDIIDAIYYAKDHGAQVINMSLGTYSNSSALKYAVDEAAAAGIVIVCAAGNDDSTTPMYPSDYSNTISVIATDSDNTKANYSDYGSAKTLSAPGTSIYSTVKNGGYAYMSGTSMASPVVAATAAMMKTVDPNMTPNEVKSALCATATDIGSAGTDSKTGAGNVNAYAAVRKAAGLSYTKESSIKVSKPSKVKKVKAKKYRKKNAKVSWSKTKGASGYVVYAAKSGKKYKKVATVKSAKKVKTVIKKLSKGKKYRIKVKAYKNYKGKRIYGSFSKATTCRL
ncbi:MAG: S8 family serine peptidase [Eubacteriaceae bacterium]|nr:S8 family serine peptidase [Eubacteriaceae bacterium]